MKISRKYREKLIGKAKMIGVIVAFLALALTSYFGVKSVYETRKAHSSLFAAQESSVSVVNGDNGYELNICAVSNNRIRKIEVIDLTTGESVKEFNYSDSETVKEENAEIRVPFGSSKTYEIKVDGNVIKRVSASNKRYIYTAEDLCAFRDSVNAGDTYAYKIVELKEDIDLSSVCYKVDGTPENDVSWVAIGKNNSKYFNGTFTGNYHKIKNLYMNRSIGEYYYGLFGYAQTLSCIRELYLENLDIYAITNSSSEYYVGGVVGLSRGKINRCCSQGEIEYYNKSSGPQSVGGIVGYITEYGRVTECYNSANVKATKGGNSYYDNYAAVGGIVGYLYNGNLEDCYNLGNIHAESRSARAGGICRCFL